MAADGGRPSSTARGHFESRRGNPAPLFSSRSNLASSPPAFGDDLISNTMEGKVRFMSGKPLVINDGGFLKQKKPIEIIGKGKNVNSEKSMGFQKYGSPPESRENSKVVSEWAHDALQRLGKGAPFSLYFTKKHLSEVASAHRNDEHHLSEFHDVMKIEYRIALRSSLRNDFTEILPTLAADRTTTIRKFLWKAARMTVARRLVAGGKVGGLGFMGSWQLEERNWREKGIWS
ncbi:3-hydroxyisobutyryl-CoA hydrolase-like protein 3, mitochondrial [Dendrobium catenatum]|uniref:3-hydroxyisobutyryl-CoA hydrolase-like protein 3, mitochondrial n=1 Tax=Dendrobium catenatum TaxID=906689 RepID=A0A2I0VVK2_9ASPA|nr:3-hydroxyisobutyryl-CoA hydrolase-like protein 3, mitochondrial [Dendrobium catenatum]